jgi:hypothetical protein
MSQKIIIFTVQVVVLVVKSDAVLMGKPGNDRVGSDRTQHASQPDYTSSIELFCLNLQHCIHYCTVVYCGALYSNYKILLSARLLFTLAFVSAK